MICLLYDDSAESYRIAQPCPDCGSRKLEAMWLPEYAAVPSPDNVVVSYDAVQAQFHVIEDTRPISHWNCTVVCLTCGNEADDAPTLPQALAKWNKL